MLITKSQKKTRSTIGPVLVFLIGRIRRTHCNVSRLMLSLASETENDVDLTIVWNHTT